MPAEYFTISKESEAELEIKKSRFICALAPATSESEARAFIAGQVSAHPKARHHCTAFVLGPDASTQRSNDDGEPSGTAGRPILDVLLHQELTDVVAVVIRYFGGVLLGAGGLIRAYGQATAEAADSAQRIRYALLQELTVDLDYQHGPIFEAKCHEFSWPILDSQYGELVSLTFAVKPEEVSTAMSTLADLTSGQAQVQERDTRYVKS